MNTRPAGSATVGYNALALRPGGSGVQTYIRELLRGLRSTQPALDLVARVQADATQELAPGVRADVRPVTDGARRVLSGLGRFEGVDLVHGLDVDLPWWVSCPAVSTVHDLAVYDTPWAFSRARAQGEQLLVRRAVRRADALVAVSAYTAQRLWDRFRRTADVVPLAAGPDMRPPAAQDVDRVRRAHHLPERFVLQVGTVEPRKDVATLAAAARGAGVPVVLAGRVDGPVPAGVRALGYVDRADLPALYGAAELVAYISVYEGFGLPPLEAMACAAPVVASAVGALPEVGAGGACELVAPRDVEGLTGVLRELLADGARREELGRRGHVRAGQLSWAATTAGTVAVYRRLGIVV